MRLVNQEHCPLGLRLVCPAPLGIMASIIYDDSVLQVTTPKPWCGLQRWFDYLTGAVGAGRLQKSQQDEKLLK